MLQYCNASSADATQQQLPAGTCLLSGDTVAGRAAASVLQSDTLAWSGGYWSPEEAAAGESEASAGEFPSAPTGRRLQQAGDEAAMLTAEGSAAWLRNTFVRGPNLSATTTAASEEECAAACNQKAAEGRCSLWALCPSNATNGG